MASAKAIALMESIYARVDKQVRDILATLPGVTVPAQQDGSVVSAERRIYNFEGPGVTVTDDPARRRVNIFIPGAPTAAPAASVFISTAGVERVFPLGTAPANWWLPAFVDSGWGLSVLESVNIAAAYTVVPTAAWITETSINGDNGTTDTQFLTRRTFTLPAGSITSATLDFNYDDDIGLNSFGGGDGSTEGVWMNGHLVTGPFTRTGTPRPHVTVDVPISWLNTGASNVLAVSVFSQAGGNALSYRITVNMSTAGVDPLYQLLSEKGDPNGYASLGAGGFVPAAELGSGSPSATTFLRGDQSYATVSTGSISVKDIDGTPTVTATVLEFPNGTVTDQTGGVARYTPTAVGISTVVNKLSGDVTLTTINTYYDGPTVSLTAGTWLITGAVTVIDTGGAANITAKLWDGTTAETSGQGYIAAASANIPIALSAIVTPASTTSYRIAVANATRGTSGAIKAAAPQNSAGNNASFLNALQLA